MKYVKLYEEFNPNELKRKYQDYKVTVINRLKKRNEQIKAAQDDNDASKAELYATKKQIDQLEIQRIDLKMAVVNIKEKRRKK